MIPASLSVIVSSELVSYGLSGNAAFRNAAQEYAAAKGWEGFNYKGKEQSVRDYCTQLFDMFDRAASEPQGLSMMQALEETEPLRVAKAYDIIDCLPAEER